ncbi:hypothetical protein T4E_1988 [Trichinella pseudospiralis]|uniref:Uncharacterized protein n=1 Tax=Trichinella pseudospiralis TaxID=6337 RepID=A0A0V0XN83_TRIPS|nr:hypothetical protein T4E_1988 [Trichinella pseudospiralis]
MMLQNPGRVNTGRVSEENVAVLMAEYVRQTTERPYPPQYRIRDSRCHICRHLIPLCCNQFIPVMISTLNIML